MYVINYTLEKSKPFWIKLVLFIFCGKNCVGLRKLLCCVTMINVYELQFSAIFVIPIQISIQQPAFLVSEQNSEFCLTLENTEIRIAF